MKSIKKGLLFGFLIWLIPFAVAFLIFPVKTSLPVLFESIMPVVITISVVTFSTLYLRKVQTDILREGIILGIVWFSMSLVIDLLMFMWGPMKMSFSSYMMDIGLTYLIIPTITVGQAFLVKK